MNITISRETLLDRLDLAGKICTKQTLLPVLQCVLLEVKENILTIRSTNLEIGIELSVNVESKKDGIVAVPASTLTQTIQHMSQKDVTLYVEDNILIVESEGSKTNIKSIPHEEFPNIPKIEESGQVVNKTLFSLGIKTASFAASLSSIKPELGSVYILQKKEHSLTFVCTDSFRLMEKTVPQKNFILKDSILIPQKNALELARVCDIRQGDPEFSVNENQCSLLFPDGVYITSRLTSGSFPDYEQIIPKEYSTHSTLLKNDLSHAFKKTNIFLNKFMQVTLNVNEKSIIVSANSGDVGKTTESVLSKTTGDDLMVSFNQRYISEPLSHIVDDSIVMSFAGIGRPLVIKGVNDSSLRYLVMPMNK